MTGFKSDGNLALAIAWAAYKHLDQLDRSGRPYILHPLRVMFAVRELGDEAMMVAVMHDLIEDCGVVREDLLERGFSWDVVLGVEVLSRPGKDAPNRPIYKDYVRAIRDAGHPFAVEVKLEDLRDNLGRVDELRPEERGLAQRYEWSIACLEGREP